MLFITSKSQATRHGVYAIEVNPPTTIQATGFGNAVCVDQFPWGPSQTLTYPSSFSELVNTIAPAGMSRTGGGYLSLIRKGFSNIGFVRTLGSTAVAATAIINKTGPTALFTVILKYPGTTGNSVVVTTAASQDGDSNHFDLTATVTGATGTTTETIHNVNFSGTGANTVLAASDKARLLLIGDITPSTTGVPIVGSTTCTGGLDGTIDATTYVGTAGTGDNGVAKLENDQTVDHFFTGDPGNSIRAAVNAGFQAHADSQGDRIAYLNGNIGQTASAAQTDVASYRSKRVVYCDPWVYIYDDTDGTKRLVSSASFAASVASQLPPSTSIAWKDSVVGTMLSGIVDLEANRGSSTALNTAAGIATFIPYPSGGFRIEAGVTTIAPVTPSVKNLTRTRLGHYIARSIVSSIGSAVDAPNVPQNQQDILDAISNFLETLKKASTREDVNFQPHILNYSVSAASSQTELDNGEFTVAISAKESSSMEKIFVLLNHGETVTVTSQ